MAVGSWKNCQPTEKKVLGRRVINVVRKKTPSKYFEWGKQVYLLKEKVQPDVEISIMGVKRIARCVVYMRNELARIASEIAAANSETSLNSTTQIQVAEIEAAVNQLFPKQLAQGALQHALEAMNYYQSQKDDNQPDNLLGQLDKI
ncbi:testis-specific Y-encoded protein, partial [Trifolium medium]|nr:testis-specific Y-encoded protein [Trifolium medium]